MNRLIGDLVDVASIEAGALEVTRELGESRAGRCGSSRHVSDASDRTGDRALGNDHESRCRRRCSTRRAFSKCWSICSAMRSSLPPPVARSVFASSAAQASCSVRSAIPAQIPSDKLETVFQRFFSSPETIGAAWALGCTSRSASSKGTAAGYGRRARSIEAAPSSSRSRSRKRGGSSSRTALVSATQTVELGGVAHVTSRRRQAPW